MAILTMAHLPAQIGCLFVISELYVVPYPRDAPRGLGVGVIVVSRGLVDRNSHSKNLTDFGIPLP